MIKLGLGRIAELLARIGDPQTKFKAFHVAGTNGKGSVCTYLESILSRRFNVGKYTSPHLVTPNDSIRIGKQDLRYDEYTEISRRIRGIAQQNAIEVTNFELQTAVAFTAFAERRVDIAVVEVGMGGKEDATNVLPPPNVLCTAITKVAVDHEAFLGSTLPAVATHKLGIMKPGVPCVIDGTNSLEVLTMAQQTASYHDIPLTITSPRGTHIQDHNRAVAHEAVKAAFPPPATGSAAGVFTDREIVESMAEAEWPGRLQWIDETTLVDGAHNVSAARELRKYVEKIGPLRFIVAFSKPADPILQALLKPGDTVVATEFGPVEEMPWIQAQPAADVAKAARKFTSNVTIQKLGAFAPFNGTTVVCGSLYLVGQYLAQRAQRPKRA